MKINVIKYVYGNVKAIRKKHVASVMIEKGSMLYSAK